MIENCAGAAQVRQRRGTTSGRRVELLELSAVRTTCALGIVQQRTEKPYLPETLLTGKADFVTTTTPRTRSA